MPRAENIENAMVSNQHHCRVCGVDLLDAWICPACIGEEFEDEIDEQIEAMNKLDDELKQVTKILEGPKQAPPVAGATPENLSAPPPAFGDDDGQ